MQKNYNLSGELVKAIERAMYGPYVLPDNAVYFAKFAVNKNVWGTIGSHIFCIDIYQNKQ